MNTPDITPPLFKIQPPHEGMDGQRTRVITPAWERIGIMVVDHRPTENKFGARIDFIPPPVSGSRVETPSLGPRRWVRDALPAIQRHMLSKDEILSLRRVDRNDYTFELDLR
jgi:hypothetical protein